MESLRLQFRLLADLMFSLLMSACAALLPSAAPTSAPLTVLPSGPTPAFFLTSSAFAEGETIPKKYTCDGINVSPQLQWDKVPATTYSLTLIVDDPDAPGGTFTHWIQFDLPPSPNVLPEGARMVGKSGLNGFGKTGYSGPCPPLGVHRYFFTLYALDLPSLDLPDGTLRTEVERAMNGHVVGKGQLLGKYSR